MREFRVGGGVPVSIADIFRKPAKERDSNEIDSIGIFASTLRGLQGIPGQTRSLFLNLGLFESFPAGRLVTCEGREPESVILVCSGRVAEFSDAHLPFVIRTYAKGDWFGECTQSSRPTSTITVEPTEIHVLPSAKYHEIALASAEIRLPTLPIFSTLIIGMDEVREKFRHVVYPVDEDILRQNTPTNDEVFVILDGSVSVSKQIEGDSILVATLRKGQAFGIFSPSLADVWTEIAQGVPDSPVTIATAERSAFLIAPRAVFAKFATEATWEFLGRPSQGDAVEKVASNHIWKEFRLSTVH